LKVEFEYLVDKQDQIPQVIQWWRSAWGDRMNDDDLVIAKEFSKSLGKTELPIDILAMVDGKAVGSAALKNQELIEVYPQYQSWLGSVFVDEAYRGQNIASQLSLRVVDMARERGLRQLYLQTQNLSGGIYKKLGWQEVERFNYFDEDGLLMVMTL
jgi:GNAT superfamily N-acetyltransferase